MQSITRRKLINAPAEQVLQVLLDPQLYGRYNPDINALKVLEVDEARGAIIVEINLSLRPLPWLFFLWISCP